MADAFELVVPNDSKHTEKQRAELRSSARERVRVAKDDAARDATDLRKSAARYVVGRSLADAINMAHCVRAPLLLTGEPGTGKTQVAYYLEWYLGLPLFRYQARSTSTSTDLRYDFDAVAYLRDAYAARVQAERGDDGEHTKAEVSPSRGRKDFLTEGPLWKAYLEAPSILLIDEIDKAPRDFPNDLLEEFAEHRFTHPFDQGEVIAPKNGIAPILICTSNAERRLPDAFLRRCIVHHIEVDKPLLERVLDARPELLRGLPAETRDRAVKRFLELRDKPGLSRRPATGELLTWLTLLAARGVGADELGVPLANLPFVRALVKVERDFEELAGK